VYKEQTKKPKHTLFFRDIRDYIEGNNEEKTV
jgi:hypothetical protein